MTDQDQEIYKDFNLTVSERWQQEIAGKGSHMQQCSEKLYFDFYLWLILEKSLDVTIKLLGHRLYDRECTCP